MQFSCNGDDTNEIYSEKFVSAFVLVVVCWCWKYTYVHMGAPYACFYALQAYLYPSVVTYTDYTRMCIVVNWLLRNAG